MHGQSPFNAPDAVSTFAQPYPEAIVRNPIIEILKAAILLGRAVSLASGNPLPGALPIAVSLTNSSGQAASLSPGFGITGDYDGEFFTYVNNGNASNDLIKTQTFKKGSTTVGVLTYNYFGSTNNISSIQRTA